MPDWMPEVLTHVLAFLAGISLKVFVDRILYAIPNDLYHKWCREHTPTGYEYFCPHSSLATFNSQQMQTFLRSMSPAAHFRVKVLRT